MGKILKYEWKKQLFSKLIIGGILIVLTAVFVVGTVLEKERWQMTASCTRESSASITLRSAPRSPPKRAFRSLTVQG